MQTANSVRVGSWRRARRMVLARHDASRGSSLKGSGGRMVPIPAEIFNIEPGIRTRVDRRRVSRALAAFEMPPLLTGSGLAVDKRLQIVADGWAPSSNWSDPILERYAR